MITSSPSVAYEKAQRIAEDTVAAYFSALSVAVPGQTAPRDVNLIDTCIDIEEALLGEDTDRAEASRQAHYLLGVAVGRRLGRL